MKIRLSFLLIAIFLLSNPLLSYSFLLKKEDLGTHAASFLKLNPSPKILSLGGYNSALSSGVEAVNINPAGLVITDNSGQILDSQDAYQMPFQRAIDQDREEFNNLSFSSSYHLYLKDINYGYLSFYKRINFFALAFSITNINIGKMLVTTKEDIYGDKNNNKFCPNFQILNISCGKSLMKDRLSLGLNTKILRSHIKESSKVNLSLDIGTIYSPYDYLNLSFLIKDLGIKLNKESLPTEIIIGSGLKLFQDVLLNLDLILPSDDRLTLTTGIEYNFQDILYTRMGYKSNMDKELKYSNLSLGLGIKIRNITLDYAYLPFGDLGDSHRMGIKWTSDNRH